MIKVNRELIRLYLDIGQTINEQQQLAGWGDAIVEQFARDLQNSFPGMRGFSSRNLWNMRDLYRAYSKNKKLQTLSAEISWSHNIAILEKCKDILEREFYMRMSKKYSWSYRILLNQMSSKAYERTVTSQTNFGRSLPENLQTQAKVAVKDEYVFSFLDAGDEYDERQLERALLHRIEEFLREVGGAYTFMGSQYKLEVGGQEFFVDILLYHRRLKSLVAIELKIGPFIPEYVGKMQFYLSVLDDTVKLQGENPSIGIILCKEKNRTIVEYTLKEVNKPINVATYQLFSELPKEFRRELPSPEQIAKLLEFIE